jgi:flagellar protein FliO/FliZ
MIDLDILLRFGLALAAVLGLIGLLALVARMRLGAGTLGGGGKRRLAVVESTALDGRTRLVLVRRDDREHLIAIHPAGVTTIETATSPATAPGSAAT